IPIIFGSRWNKYELSHTRNLGGPVDAVLKLPAKKDVYVIRKMSIAEDRISSFRKRELLHKNLCTTREIFTDGGEFYCVTEPAAVTLRHVCRCPQLPSKELLVSITKQMLAGVSYLSSEKLFHSCLGIDSVVICSDGVVKIAQLEHCEPDVCCSSKNTEAFGRTTMMLMNKYASETEEIALRYPHKWSKAAADFLSSTTT
ncbi:hypothetical protein EJ07DRAFT_79963, partial [Lizonia empirigonia]